VVMYAADLTEEYVAFTGENGAVIPIIKCSPRRSHVCLRP